MEGQTINFPSQNSKGDGHGVLFPCPGSDRGLIVIHEWWGMNETIQKEAREMSRDGRFTVLVPDMYRGALATDREHAGHLKDNLDWNGAVSDLRGAAKYLLSTGCKKVGVTGFCMGGALAFAAALHVPEISAAAPFYGTPSLQLADPTKITIPIQAHFGSKDTVEGFSTPAVYRPLREKMLAAGVPLEFHEYDAAHAFTNPTSPNFDAEAAKTALDRMYDFMNKNLN